MVGWAPWGIRGPQRWAVLAGMVLGWEAITVGMVDLGLRASGEWGVVLAVVLVWEEVVLVVLVLVDLVALVELWVALVRCIDCRVQVECPLLVGILIVDIIVCQLRLGTRINITHLPGRLLFLGFHLVQCIQMCPLTTEVIY